MTFRFHFRPQMPADLTAVEALHETAFGPGRFARTAHRIREASTVPPAIALTGWDGAVLVGAIQFTAITIGGAAGAMLLGPLAIAPAYRNMGCGLRLMTDGLAEAGRLGARLVVLVGDLPYYQRAGFRQIPPGRMALGVPARVREGYQVPAGYTDHPVQSYVQRGRRFRAELRRLEA